MRVALLTTFTASRKEPLAALLERIRAAFLTAGQGEPSIRFSFSDAPLPGFVSSVDRVLKRHPQLQRFLVESAVRQISNDAVSSDVRASGEPVPFDTLLAIAAGVPRSFPFHGVSFHLHSAAFGESTAGVLRAGVMISDAWWINGRMRSLSALTLVDADPAGKKLPPLPEPVAAILAACGKMKKTAQAPFPPVPSAAPAAPQSVAPDPAAPNPAASNPAASNPAAPNPVVPNPDVARAVRAVVEDYRARFDEILERAALPHDFPPVGEALQNTPLGQTTGPKKPVLVRAFKPLGYDCQSASGTFTLRRRTPRNLTVEISLDVGTWSRSLTAFFKVHGLGFRALLPLPPSRRAAGGGQYPIGDAERWQQLVDNLAALVTELDRSFVPAIEAASGPAPEWYRPET
jgi:hypothetical protein